MGIERDEMFYNRRWPEADRRIDGGMYDGLYRLIVEMLGPGETVLDLGCGTGRFAGFVVNAGRREYIGVDFSATAISLARAKGIPGCVFLCCTIDGFLASTDIFADVVTMLEVLEHIEHDLELIEMLPAGKRVIFTVPNFDFESHVRYFKNIGEVMDRYCGSFRELIVTPHVEGDRIYWIGRGIRSSR